MRSRSNAGSRPVGLGRAIALLELELVHGGQDPQSSLVHESTVYRAEATRKRRVHRNAESDGLTIHRAAC